MNPSDNPSQPLEKIKDIMSYFSSRYVDRFLKCVFVWFDPEQKSPQLTNEFIDDLHVPVIGLTGTKEQIDQLKKSFRLDGDCQLEVAQQKHENHSDSIYLVGPDCFVWRIFSMNDDIMAIVQDIQLSIHQYTEKKLDAIKS
ncbi:Protein SCO1 1, mitochondrial [Thelohanellus kitauei]|uniref:Protein SCO1 1, mitochondrial n=1 Tax=Thelohanellus kitauei TaxID=669202 RepID=A0A0C2MZZ2_THEKT|nr:Protein SCO1 1, mitochondrial [Thelohanellus kitauei]